MLVSLTHDAKYHPWHILLLDQGDQNKMQHEFFAHVKPLVSASVACDANSTINGTTPFV